MLIKFNQSVHLAGKDYPRGMHEVSQEVMEDKFFIRLVHAGMVGEAEKKEVVSAMPIEEHRRNLVEKILSQTKKKTPVAVDSSPSQEPAASDEAQSLDAKTERLASDIESESEALSESDDESPKSEEKKPLNKKSKKR